MIAFMYMDCGRTVSTLDLVNIMLVMGETGDEGREGGIQMRISPGAGGGSVNQVCLFIKCLPSSYCYVLDSMDIDMIET